LLLEASPLALVWPKPKFAIWLGGGGRGGGTFGFGFGLWASQGTIKCMVGMSVSRMTDIYLLTSAAQNKSLLHN
jgi:hypothetical protein